MITIKNNQVQAKYYYQEKEETVHIIGNDGVDLPKELIIGSGKYRVFGKVFNLRNEGLYRFRFKDKTENRIVYQHDPWAIISAVAWLDNPGVKTKKNLKSDKLKELVSKYSIDLSCGGISSFADVLLQEVGIESRSVTGISPEQITKKDGDTGHTLLEVKINDTWLITDVDNNVIPRKNGQNLTFWEFLKVVGSKDYELVKIANDKNDKNPTEIKDYYAKLFKIGLINDKRFYYFIDNPDYTPLVRSYAKIYMPLQQVDWLEKFYPGYNYR